MLGKCNLSKKAINSLILALLGILFSNAHLQAEKLLVDEIFEAAVPCIVQIHIYDETGEFLAGGTGFFIGPGKILTCAHVMEDAHSAIVVSSIKKYYQIKILKMDDDMDLALLMINGSGEKSLPFENERVPIRNQNLIALGYDFEEHKNAVSFGLVHAVISYRRFEEIINSVPVFPGWSGGPLLNLEGCVIGVTSSTIGDGPMVAFSIGPESIKGFLQRPNNPKDLAYARSSVLWSVILEKLGAFWRIISGWIANSVRRIIEFIFFHGALRGAFISILAGILVGWRSKILYMLVRAWKRRKAINKIIKWSNGYSSLEIGSVLETRPNKGKYHSLSDGRFTEIVLD